MKKFLSVFISIILIFSLGLSAYAQDTDSIKEEYIKEESNEIETIIKNLPDSPHLKWLVENNAEFDTKNAQKVYDMTTLLLVTEYKKIKNFSSLISDEYTWRVPAHTRNGDICVYIEKSPEKGIWDILSTSNELDDMNFKQVFRKDSLLKTLPNVDYKIVSASLYGMLFVYYIEGNTEYVKPYFNVNRDYKLSNAKSYKASKAIKILDNNFTEPANVKSFSKDGEILFGNYSITPRIPIYYIVLPACFIIALFLLSVFLILKVKKRKTND